MSVGLIRRLEDGKSKRPAPLVLQALAAGLGLTTAVVLGLAEIPSSRTPLEAFFQIWKDVVGSLDGATSATISIRPEVDHDSSGKLVTSYVATIRVNQEPHTWKFPVEPGQPAVKCWGGRPPAGMFTEGAQPLADLFTTARL